MSQAARILVVDDDPNMAQTLAHILRFKGYEARVALSASEALNAFGGSGFDCVISDIKMPDVDGIQLQRAIKDQSPETSIVLMTAYSSDDLVVQGMKEGANTVLSKPLNIDHLLILLRTLRLEPHS